MSPKSSSIVGFVSTVPPRGISSENPEPGVFAENKTSPDTVVLIMFPER